MVPALLSASPAAFATNGMNLEGYGTKSHALGGTSMAYDTGNSAVMNNPATLGMMEDGSREFGAGIKGLHPDVNLDYYGLLEESGGDAYLYAVTLLHAQGQKHLLGSSPAGPGRGGHGIRQQFSAFQLRDADVRR